MKHSWLLGLALVGVAVIGCNGSKTEPGPETKLETVNAGYLPMISSLTHFVAEDQGFYKEQGLDVKATRIATSNLIASQLVEGKIDVGIELSIVPLLKSTKAGGDAQYKIFSASSVTADDSFDGIVVKKDSPIKSIADLAGKNVATFPGTTSGACLVYRFNELAPGKPAPNCKPTAPDLQLQSLETGAVDALYAYEPTLSRALASDTLRLLPDSGIYSQLQDKSPVGVAALNAKFAADHPETAKKIVAALDKAAQFIRDNPEKAREILAKAEKVDPKVTANMHDLNMGLSSEVDFDVLKRFESLLQKMGEAGDVPLSKNGVFAR